jgi:ubiquinone/menaquinone biosynthesis C-methylase UbiE
MAPEKPVRDFIFKMFPHAQYITGNKAVSPEAVNASLVEFDIDIQAIPFPGNYFDIVICNHVLEHVPDDQKAMREFYRVLKPGGIGFISAPFDPKLARTVEETEPMSEKEREKLFGQHDHVRLYGKDYVDRLRLAGFQVQNVQLSEYYASYFMQYNISASAFKNREYVPGFKERYTVSFKAKI